MTGWEQGPLGTPWLSLANSSQMGPDRQTGTTMQLPPAPREPWTLPFLCDNNGSRHHTCGAQSFESPKTIEGMMTAGTRPFT